MGSEVEGPGIKNNKFCSATSDKILNLCESFPCLSGMFLPHVSVQVYTIHTHPKNNLKSLLGHSGKGMLFL